MQSAWGSRANGMYALTRSALSDGGGVQMSPPGALPAPPGPRSWVLFDAGNEREPAALLWVQVLGARDDPAAPPALDHIGRELGLRREGEEARDQCRLPVRNRQAGQLSARRTERGWARTGHPCLCDASSAARLLQKPARIMPVVCLRCSCGAHNADSTHG